MNKKVKILIYATLLLAVSLSIWEAASIRNAHKKMRDIEWCQTATQDEMREMAHKVIKYPIGDPHDAYLLLRSCGNEESIEYLENRAKGYSTTGPQECTVSHCFEALETVKNRVKNIIKTR